MTKMLPQIGKYRIVSELAKGGMGAVYKAEHPTLNRFVVLKKLALPGNAAFIERFRREAQIMMDFRNEYIVDVYDHFKEGPFYYIVLEYVDGLSLDKLIERERYLPNDISLLIFLESSRALKYAHDKNVIHRDIKPQNILISYDGKVKLTDFGIAASQDFDESGLTREGMTMGTPSYISPEQIQNTRGVDKRADIYSIGVTLYEMVTGKTPYPGNFSPETVARIQKGKYRAPHKINPRVSPLARKIIRKCMNPRRSRRYSDLGEVIKILERYFAKKDPKAVGEAVKHYVLQQDASMPVERYRRLRGVAAVLFLFLFAVGGTGYYTYISGYFHEYLFPARYGLFSLAVDVPLQTKAPGQVFVRAELLQETGDGLVPVRDTPLDFPEISTDDTNGTARYTTPWLYMKAGPYRVRVEAENRVSMISFFLEPRTLQKLSPQTTEGRRVEVRSEGAQPEPVQFSYTIRNRATGIDITKEVSVFLMVDGQWVPWDPFFSSYLTSGNTYRFRILRERFYPTEYELSVAPFQTDLELKGTLTPHSGFLRITSEQEGIDLLLNNQRFYISGGPSGDMKELGRTASEPQVLELSPGTYILTASSSEFITRDIRVTVRSDSLTDVSLRYDSEKDSIELLAGEGKE